MKDDDFNKAYDLWYSFKEELLYKNRFLSDHEVIKIIKEISITKQNELLSNQVVYRARVFSGNINSIEYLTDIYKDSTFKDLSFEKRMRAISLEQEIGSRPSENFWGYDAEKSFAPKDRTLIKEGRLNPSNIKYLYTAEKEYTALVEVRPFLNQVVSISKIEIGNKKKLFDLTYEVLDKFNSYKDYLFFFITNEFSEPVNNNNIGYIPTQFLAEYIKNLGFDGIRYNSSLHKLGRNIVLFNFDDCKVISSSFTKVEDVCYEARCISPKNNKLIIHEKLREYHDVKLREFFKKMRKQATEE